MPRPTDGQCCRVISRDGLTPTAPQAEVGRQVQGPGSFAGAFRHRYGKAILVGRAAGKEIGSASDGEW